MELDCLLIYIPKLANFYRLYGEYMFGMLMPVGLLSIADIVHQEGYNIQVLHFGIEKIINPNFSIKEYVKETKPKIIGLSLHWHHQSYDVMNIAKEIKSIDSSSFIVLGGITATYFYEEIMEKFSYIDGIIRGDGEISFLRLVKEILNGKRDLFDIPNLSWRNEDETIVNEINYVTQSQDLDRLKFTNFDLLKHYQLYINYVGNRWFWSKGLSNNMNLTLIGDKQNIFPLPISRGCSVDCSFCGGGKFAQKTICGRTNIAIRSINSVIESIQEAIRYDYDIILIEYFPFNEDPLYFEKLFDRIKRERIKINCILESWTLPSKGVIQSFKETFCDLSKSRIYISPESGSEKVRRLNKGYYFTNDQLIEVLEYMSIFKIPFELYFSLGLPFETVESIKATKVFQERLKREFRDLLTIRTELIDLEPGSPMYNNPKRYSIVRTRNSFMDFYHAHSNKNKSISSILNLGYFQLYFNGQKIDRKSYEKYIKEIKCKDFCRLSNFLLSNFIKTDKVYISKMISFCSRLFCTLIGLYWQLKACLDFNRKSKKKI